MVFPQMHRGENTSIEIDCLTRRALCIPLHHYATRRDTRYHNAHNILVRDNALP